MRKWVLILGLACVALLLAPTESVAQFTGTQTCVNTDGVAGCDKFLGASFTPLQKIDLTATEYEVDDCAACTATTPKVVCAITIGQTFDEVVWIHVFLQDATTVTPGTTAANFTLLVPNSTTTQKGPSGNVMPFGVCAQYTTGLTAYAVHTSADGDTSAITNPLPVIFWVQ